jgi:HSP20 family protein
MLIPGGHSAARIESARPYQEEEATMTLVRWNPGALSSPRDLLGIQDEVNQLFDSFFGRSGRLANGGLDCAPPVDIEETPEEFVLRADLPGVSQKDVKVSLRGDSLTLRGERKAEREQTEGNWRRSERVHGVFERSFTLGAPVRSDKAKATYRDGVLEIRVPKAEEARLREIEVQVG